MHSDKSTIVELKKPYDFFRNEKGAIDLASIMVGVIVIGLIGGVVATTVFAIIPWAQDRAAKQQVDAIVTAQSSYRGLSSDPTLAVAEGHSANSYAASTQLASAGLLAENPNYCTVGTDEGEGYLAVALSGSGKYWAATDDATKPREISPSEAPESCDFVPYVDKTPTLTVMTYKCETTLEVVVPIRDGVGTATWSDGVTTTHDRSSFERTLQAGVEYKLTFDGTYTQFGSGTYFPGTDCLISLDHWGAETGVTDASDAFFGARNLIDVPSHIPPTISDTESMFNAAGSFNDPDVNNWDVSNVTNMHAMFLNAAAFNQPLNNWDVSKVEDMSFMFTQASVFNQPLDKWDTGNVVNMGNMFSSSSMFNQNINDWDVSNVENMHGMFFLTPFNEPLDKWDTRSLKYASSMFNWAKSFNQNINDWDVSNVETMRSMFSYASAFNQPLDKWNTKNVTDMGNMFYGSSFSQPLNNWNVSKVKDMGSMFEGSNFNEPLNEWDVSNVANMSYMFNSAFNQNINDWDVSNVENMNAMFYNNIFFDQPLNKWDVSKVTDMGKMFMGATAFNQPLNSWKVVKVINMQEMFYNAQKFDQPLNNWNVSTVENMPSMFLHAVSFNQNLSGWNTVSVKDGSTFANASFPASSLPPRTMK